MRRRVLIGLAIVLALLVAGCEDQRQSQSISVPASPPNGPALFTQADIGRAVEFLKGRTEREKSHHRRAIVLASGANSQGSWVGVVVYSSGKVEALQGEGVGNGALIGLLSPGDYVLIDGRYSSVLVDKATLVVKGAVPIGGAS